jgi:transcriptional regulator with XRE-family HTH domain
VKPKGLEAVLAKRLRELAELRGIPLSHLADRAGIARSYLWRVLDAESSATLDLVQRLAAVLNENPVDLLVDARTQAVVRLDPKSSKGIAPPVPNPIKGRRATKRS